MIPNVNIPAVLVAGFSTMVVGGTWYSPKVLGNVWMKLAKVDPEKAEKGGIRPMIVALSVSFLTAYVLATFISFAHTASGAARSAFLMTSLSTAVLAWLGFTAVRILTHDGFEGRPAKLTLLTVSHELLTFLVMALVIGLMGP